MPNIAKQRKLIYLVLKRRDARYNNSKPDKIEGWRGPSTKHS